jgi:hypothetical protein
MMHDVTGLPEADRTRIKQEWANQAQAERVQLQVVVTGRQSGCSQPACTQEPRNQFAGGQELCGLHTLGVLNSGY